MEPNAARSRFLYRSQYKRIKSESKPSREAAKISALRLDRVEH
jgi:hypothetical protein